jgi:hypothetical protein
MADHGTGKDADSKRLKKSTAFQTAIAWPDYNNCHDMPEKFVEYSVLKPLPFRSNISVVK